MLEGERLLLAMYGLLREMMQLAPTGDESGPEGASYLRQYPQPAIQLQLEFIC